MRFLLIILFYLISHIGFGQAVDKNLQIIVTDSLKIDADSFIGTDPFKNIYYLKDDILYKKSLDTTLTFKAVSLGKIASVDIKNPLKILVFYNDFNAVVLLDNNLNKLGEDILFNQSALNLNITYAQWAGDEKLWLYSNDDNRLHVFDYISNKIIKSSRPLNFYQKNFSPIYMISSYKNCWLVGKNYVLEFDEYGYFKSILELDKTNLLRRYNNNFYTVKENSLFKGKLLGNLKKFELKIPIPIQSFYVLNNEIYIFDGKMTFIYKEINH